MQYFISQSEMADIQVVKSIFATNAKRLIPKRIGVAFENIFSYCDAGALKLLKKTESVHNTSLPHHF